jgi:potassium efflux system protein
MSIALRPKIRFPEFALCTTLIGIICSLSPVVQAQTEGPPRVLRDAPVNREAVQKSLDQVKADVSLNEDAKAAIEKIFQTALTSLDQAATFSAEVSALKEVSANGPGEISEINSELANRNGGKAPTGTDGETPLPENATEQMINARMTSEKARLTDLTRQVRELEEELTEIESRSSTNREQVVEVTRQLSDAQGLFSRWSGKPVSGLKEKAELAADQAAIKVLRTKLVKLEQEALTLPTLNDLTKAKRDLANSNMALARERVSVLEKRSGAIVKSRITEAERLVKEVGIESVEKDPLFAGMAKEIRQLTAENQVIMQKITEADKTLKKAQREQDQLQRDSESIRTQIEFGGLESEFSERILELRGSLPTAKTYRPEAAARRSEISKARLDSFRQDHELDQLSNPAEQRSQLLESLKEKGLPDADLKKIEPDITNLINARIQLRKDAAEGNRKLAQILGEIDLIESQTVAFAIDFQEFLVEKLMWAASSPPLGANAFTGMRTAGILLVGPDALTQYAKAVLRIGFSKWLLAVILTLILLLPRRRLRRHLADTVARTKRVSTDSIGNTVQALLVTLWLALPIPVLLWFFGWVFSSDFFSTPTTYALGKGLSGPAVLLFVFRFSAILCWPGGVAEEHFRWNRQILSSCYRALMAAILFYLPAHMVLAIWFNGTNLASFHGPGRLVFIVAMFSISFILLRLFRSSGGILAQMLTTQSWAGKLRKVWSSFLILLPISLAILAALGHFLTAVVMAYQIQNSAIVLLSGALIHGLLTRWITVKERRLALQNAIALREAKRQAQREAAEAAEESGRSEISEIAPIKDDSSIAIEEEESLSWGEIGEQTRHLIRAVVAIAVVFGCWWVWSDMVPVLKSLDTRYLFGEVSLGNLVWLGVITVITTVVFQNLPGLLEVTFLQALGLEAGVRNAIVTICQYAIVAIGVVVAFNALGLDMAKFGWIAAALSVGLGFGLQEVVANFVSGLILLFERPIRVGDIVTIGGVDGVVTRIRIRATTISNWDKKEFIVPNKEFITGTLLNWTLSSPMTRLVFPVGVAYGSDIRKVQEILLNIARKQPEVLKDPEPVAVFELFGDSCLNFSLRCYLPRPEMRLEMTHRINTEIHDQFLASGIEIPFPQRDLHLRSVDPSIRFSHEGPKGL